MIDRVSTYPGRITLTPVDGQSNTYDMLRADVPIEEGTPLNKSTLLADSTAALLDLGTDATVDDMLALLADNSVKTTLYNLIYNSSALSNDSLASNDFVGIADVSDTTGKRITVQEFLNYAIRYGTVDMTAGSSSLPTGVIYVKYE